MKKWIWFGFAGAMLLWLFGTWALLPSVQSTLERAVIAELAKPEYTGAFDDVKVSFSGQEATLTGKVATQSDHDLLSDIVSKSIRTPGSSLNPVTHVANGTARATELARLRPKPWLMIAKFNGQGVIAGALPVDLKDKASEALSAKLTGVKITNTLNSKLDSEAKVRLALDAKATLDAGTIPQLADNEVAVSTVGGHWTTLKTTKTDFDIASALSNASVDSSDVIEALLPLRTYQAAEAEKARQATLPPAYAGIVALPEALHIYGLTGDDESQRKLLSALGAAYPKRKILTSAMKVSTEIRNNSDWTSALADLPKGDSDNFVAALPVGGKAVIYKDKGDQAAMQKALASALPASFDFKGLWEPYGNWLKPPAPPPPAPVPAPPAAPKTPNLKVGAPTVNPSPATGAAPTLKLGPATPAAPAVKTLPPPSGNPPPSAVTIPAPTPAPAPATPPAK